MKTLDLIAYQRPSDTRRVIRAKRKSAFVPCVVYGYKQPNRHVYVPLSLFRSLTHTSSLHFVRLDIEGDCVDCILQDTQYHPVSGVLVHADFLVLDEKRMITMEVPVHAEGTPEGVIQGGKLMMQKRRLRVRALPKSMPEVITIEVSHLGLGAIVRVKDIALGDYVLEEREDTPVLSVQIPRVAKLAETTGETEATPEGEAAPAAADEGETAADTDKEKTAE